MPRAIRNRRQYFCCNPDCHHRRIRRGKCSILKDGPIHLDLVRQFHQFQWSDGLYVHNACRIALDKWLPVVSSVDTSSDQSPSHQDNSSRLHRIVDAESIPTSASVTASSYNVPVTRGSSSLANTPMSSAKAAGAEVVTGFVPSSSGTAVAALVQPDAPAYVAMVPLPRDVTHPNLPMPARPDRLLRSAAAAADRVSAAAAMAPATDLADRWAALDPVSDLVHSHIQAAAVSEAVVQLDELLKWLERGTCDPSPSEFRTGRVGGMQVVLIEARDLYATALHLCGFDLSDDLPTFVGPSSSGSAQNVDSDDEKVTMQGDAVAAVCPPRASIRLNFLQLTPGHRVRVLDFFKFSYSTPVVQMRHLAGVCSSISVDAGRQEFRETNFLVHPVSRLLKGSVIVQHSFVVCLFILFHYMCVSLGLRTTLHRASIVWFMPSSSVLITVDISERCCISYACLGLGIPIE